MKTRLAMILALSLLASLVLAPAALAKSTNQVDHWEQLNPGFECTKIEMDEDAGPTWISDDEYALVVLKSSRNNDEFRPVEQFEDVTTKSGKDISHIITCRDLDGDDLDGDD